MRVSWPPLKSTKRASGPHLYRRHSERGKAQPTVYQGKLSATNKHNRGGGGTKESSEVCGIIRKV